jgi:hypothetical protein
MRRLLCLAGFVLVQALAGCAATHSKPAETREIAQLAGVVNTSDFFVPAGEIILIPADFELRASGVIRIDGVLRAVHDPEGSGWRDAPCIKLCSPLGVVISGSIEGARGRDGRATFRGENDLDSPDRMGGFGSDIVIDAPLSVVDGVLTAGDGGLGGAHSRGGRGGDVLFLGNAVTSNEAPNGAGAKGGMGGGARQNLVSGLRSGEPGRAGNAIVQPTAASATPMTSDQLLEYRFRDAAPAPRTR